MEWISIKDKMPEKEGIYYVMHSRFFVRYVASWQEKERLFIFVGENINTPTWVTHWASM